MIRNIQLLKIGFLCLNLIMFLLSSFSIPIKLQGIVKDSILAEPLSYVNVRLLNYTLGTCTNQFGEFQLLISDSLMNEQLIISHIGYHSKKMLVKNLVKGYNEIFLTSATIQLNDIEIIPPKLSADEILKNVIKNHSKNYPRNFCFYETFFRDIVSNESSKAVIKSCRLTEAAISIQDYGINANRDTRFKVHEIRNSYNYTEASLFARAIIWEINNPLDFVYSYVNIISKDELRELLKDKCYSQTISDISIVDNRLVYIIDLRQEYSKFLGMIYKRKNLYRLLRLFIDSKDWSISEATYYVTAKGFDALNDTLLAECHIKMQDYNNKHYLKLINYNGWLSDDYFKFSSEHEYIHHTSLIVNQVIQSRKSIENIKKRNAMKINVPLWDMKYTYHPEFWRNYNILLDRPLDSRVRDDLEYDIPLEEQFKSVDH